MSIQKEVFGRSIDALIIGSLFCIDARIQQFGLWLAAFITISGLLLIFAMDRDSSKKYYAKGFRLFVRIVFGAGYVLGLILSGSPIWAAFYLLAVVCLQVRADALVKGEG